MIRKKNGSIEWLEFELFAPYPQMKAAVLLRHGGVSNEPYGSLNAGSGGDDTEENIEKNRLLVARALGIENIKACDQPHKANVSFIPNDPEEFLRECDGMITNRDNEALLIKHADCQAAIFFDPVTRTIANVHAGWRGQVQNIYRATVERLERCVGAKPENILVAVSPSLGPQRSEFINFRTEWPEEYWKFQFRPTYFDLWAIGKHQMVDAGIQPKNIQFAEICTYSNPNDFFSYRRQRPTGGHATIAYLCPPE